ncbi:hypothetical protein D8674_028145 [Pyrus ussuriensis x Pyrus communis]|uniref:NADH-ubiquinone oxidoreductase 21kDa subunit N-terminal domain-containing protein n=1 Tax=Pyrus ussuriensis x Pyrus communis TaxID=2448454 RepID=A0A5N5IGF3_9ROSA|nr:hypothetical protein D8674_028145 [Pyrus ussuriensis x Pyrus communis]
MNTDITASTKPEYPVIDRNPPFTTVVGNFGTLDYFRFATITGVSVTVGYLSGIKPGIRGPSMVTGGLIGVMGGFMYAYQNSAGRLMGFFPNDDEDITSNNENIIFIGDQSNSDSASYVILLTDIDFRWFCETAKGYRLLGVQIHQVGHLKKQ